MSHFFTPDDYAIAVAESPVAQYVYTPYCWSTETITRCLEEAGFSKVNALYPPVSKEGLEAKKEGYWASYQADPFVVAIEAFRE